MTNINSQEIDLEPGQTTCRFWNPVPYSTIHYKSYKPFLDTMAEDCRTIRVKGINPKTWKDTLENYFSSPKRGGEISDIQYDSEKGMACITFAEPKGAEQALRSIPHSIEGANLTVQARGSECMEPNKLYVEGFHKETSTDCLKFYIERISNADVEDVTFGSKCNAIITVDGTLDLDAIHQRSQGKPLEGRTLKITPVPICRTILVSDLPSSVSEENILFKFESPRSGGGEVEKVQLDSAKRTALIQFKNPEVIQSVLAQDQTIGGTKLTVKRYHLLLGDLTDHRPEEITTEAIDGKSVPAEDHPIVSTTAHQIEVDHELYEYLKAKHQANLKWALNTGNATADDSKHPVVIHMSSSEEENSVKEFLKDFKHEVIPFDLVLVDHGMKEKMQKVFEIFKSSKAVSFHENYDEGYIKILGRTVNTFSLAVEQVDKCVKEVKAEFEEKNRQHEECIEMSIVQVKVLQNSGKYQASIEAWKQEGITLHVDTARGIQVKGSQNQLTKVKEEIQHLLHRFREKELELKPSLLLASTVAIEYVKKQLAENFLDIEFSTSSNGKISLHGVEKAHVDEAHELITRSIDEFNIPLSDTGPNFRRQHVRDEFLNNVGSSIPMSLLIERDELTVVCFNKDMSNIRLKLAFFLEETGHDKVHHELEKAVARYFRLHGETILQGLRMSSPDVTIELDGNVFIISGPKSLVASCHNSIKELIQNLTKEKMDFGTPETCASITDETAEKIILGIEQARKCAIVVNVREEKVDSSRLGSTSTNKNEMEELRNKTLQCRYVYPNGRIIEVHQGDILNHPVDFLVNSANDELKHKGGLAKAIVDKGGPKIQEDCFNYLKEERKLKLMPGDVVTTDGGDLLCKKILHVVVPKWKSDSDLRSDSEGTREGRYLRHGCLAILDKAKDGKTVAIPALGTGIYEIPFVISAKSIVAAVDDFMRQNNHYELKEVRLVDNNPDAVDAFMKEMTHRYGNDYNFSINKRVPDKWGSTPKTDNTDSFPTSVVGGTVMRTREGMAIRLTVGNIANCTEDVIVNTVHCDLNLTKNPSSNALLLVAGNDLGDSCAEWTKKNGKLKEGCFAETTGANLKCKKVFHVCCPHWKPEDGEQKLRQLVKNLLSGVENRKLESVAFPALGTGSLKYPEEIVAKVLFDESIKFSKANRASCLKAVNIVVYQDNAKAVEKFTEEFRTRSGKRATTLPRNAHRASTLPVITRRREMTAGHETRAPTPRRISESRGDEVPLGSANFKIEIVHANIVQESTDAIAFLVGNSIQEGGQIGIALLKEAGECLKREYDKISKIDSGSVVLTSAGNLKAKCLLHMVPKKSLWDSQPSSKYLRESVTKCLVEADSYQLTSISLPAIGTGHLRRTGKESAEIMHAGISEYAKRPTKLIQLIRIVILQPNVFQEFKQSFQEQSKSSPVSSSVTIPDKDEDSGASSATRTRRRITLDIVVESKDHLGEITEDLLKIEKERCLYKVIEDESITELPHKYLEEIQELQNQHCVLIESKPEIGYLRISGLSENVSNASSAVYEKIVAYEKEKRRLMKTGQEVQWLFYDDTEGTVVIPEKYDEKANAEIEKAFQQGQRNLVIGENYKIDFDAMLETNTITKQTMKIFRSSREGFPLPDHWECQPIARETGKELEVHLVNIDAHEHPHEYDEIYDMFKKTMGEATVLSIQRIQNPRLYQIYKSHEKKMNERGGCNEQKLFHGTAKETMKSINNTGFNRSYCGKNATRFGKGVYFARNAKYSARTIYAVPDENRVQYMYVARVLVGQYTKGKEGIIVPPPIDDHNATITYDTVVDDVSNPKIFVVFYDYQCYPEYLITFKDPKAK